MIEPYYSEDGITLYCARAEDVLPQLSEKSVDFGFADPPYGIEKAEWDCRYPEWWFERELLRVCTRGVAVTPGQDNIATCIMRMGNDYRGIHFARNLNGMTFGGIGFENFIAAVIGGEARRGMSYFDFVVRGEKPKHPSPKPTEYMAKLLERFTEEKEIVIDCFVGSGTTLVAAKRLGRKAVGIEMSEAYCKIAVQRLSQKELFGIENGHGI